MTVEPASSAISVPQRIKWNPLTFATVAWIYPVLRTGYKKPLEESDLPLLGENESAINLQKWLDAYVAQAKEEAILAAPANKKNPKLTLLNALFPRVLPIVVVDAFCQLTAVAMTTLQSLMIGEILKYVNPLFPREDLFWNNGVGLAFLMLGMQLLYTFAETISQSIGMVLQLRIKGAVVNAVYKKSLNLSSKSRRAFPAGKVNSLASSDVQMIMAFVESVNKVWSMPVQLCLSLYFVSRLMGVATATAGGIFVGLAGLSAALSGPLGNAFKEYMKTLDKRTTVLREFLYGVKVVKYHALEDNARERIQAARAKQITAQYRIVFGFTLLIGVIVLQNTLTSPLTFITYGALGHEMSPQIIFPSLSFLSSLMAISGMLPQIVFAVLQSTVSYKRLSNFLLAEEAVPEDKPSSEAVAADNASSIILDKVSFTWEQVSEVKDEEELKAEQAKEKKLNKKNKGKVTPPLAEKVDSPAIVETDSDVFALENFSFSVKKGSLVAVVGATGSGKSSLLAGLAGSMRKTSGNATIFGSVAYCPQEPWIISGTIQENITLLDADLADAAQIAVEACSLTKDLNSFPAGIKTQIGEKGINLSGGQKARIALARAITKNPDVYILDDPLSALDSHVSKDIFENTIQGPLMKSKTVVIATHLLHILPQVDQVIVLDGGKIVQNGTYNDLIADTNGKLFETMKDYHLDDEETASKSTKKATVAAKETDKEETAEAEDRETGAVSFATYKSYAKAIGFHWLFIEAAMFILLCGAYVAEQLALSAWTTNYWNLSNPNTSYLYIYLGLSIFVSLVDVTNFSIVLYACVGGGRYFHDVALEGLLRAPMTFFDQQPIGRILNRMTADVRSLDNGTGMIITNLFDSVYIVVATLIITCISSWQVIPIVFGLVICLVFLYRFFKSSYRELRRLNAIMQSPLTAHVSETMTGIPTILAYNSQDVFIEKQLQKLDKANLSQLLFNNTMYWIIMRLNLLGAFITFSVAILGVTGVMPSALVGVALTQISYFAPVIQGVLLLIANLEANFVSVERLNHYANSLPQEAPRILPKDATLSNWPTAGSIEIRDLKLAYESRPDHLVVNGISLKIQAGEKVGVVGRTGSGKSTLMDSFFRLIEAQSGTISIDGENISSLGLKKLRTSIQMIPQNPVLFDGTVRSNIDVLTKYSDDDLWYALECVGMKEYVSGLSGKLDSPITEGGTNLSAGQRQLLCLAKVLLEKSKILIMDEATSSVDAESDKRIQDSMKTYFKDATVLSVAHRLNTIAAFDKVLVLENGKVAEFEPPHLLLSREGTIFGEMVNATGVANAAVIREIAKDHYYSSK
ncbi:hypothetical protein HDU79_001439 [Rhizoclosmatium sp. JEL0117]|nr:hypothetical protein HDU79_001439 [Rhizoclosmatium sp. JEL0117]